MIKLSKHSKHHRLKSTYTSNDRTGTIQIMPTLLKIMKFNSKSNNTTYNNIQLKYHVDL